MLHHIIFPAPGPNCTTAFLPYTYKFPEVMLWCQPTVSLVVYITAIALLQDTRSRMFYHSWFTELDVKNILNVLHEAEFADGDWFQLGQQLIKHSALKTIEANHSGGSHCMIDTISQWLRTDLEASWVKLAEAVTKVGGYGEVTAEIVRQNACKGKDDQE